MLDDTTPSFREFLLNHLTLPDDRDHVGVVGRLKQLAVVEPAIENSEEISEDSAGGVNVFESAYRQREAFVLDTPSG